MDLAFMIHILSPTILKECNARSFEVLRLDNLLFNSGMFY